MSFSSTMHSAITAQIGDTPSAQAWFAGGERLGAITGPEDQIDKGFGYARWASDRNVRARGDLHRLYPAIRPT